MGIAARNARKLARKRRAADARLVEAMHAELRRRRERLAEALASGEIPTMSVESVAGDRWALPDTSPLDDIRAALERK